MLVIIIVMAIIAGSLLWYSRATRLSSEPLARWAHRVLAGAALIAACTIGGNLMAGSTALVAACGFLSARVRNRDLGIMLFVAHLAGAISLLIFLGLAGHLR